MTSNRLHSIRALWLLVLGSSLVGCAAGAASNGSITDSGSSGGSGSGTAGRSGAPGSTGGATGSTGAPPAAAQLLALTQSCSQVSGGLYKTDSNVSATVPICGLNGAFFWTADMDVDCDGKTTAQCNPTADPWYQNDTSLHDTHDQPLDAANLPYVVIPLPSSRFAYTDPANQLALGDVVAVIYGGQVNYGVFGDEGPSAIIGEASYAMAASLGIDPNPATGGADTGVTYIVFKGPGAVLADPADHAAAVQLGQVLAAQLVQNN